MKDEELIFLLRENPYSGMKALTKQYAGLVYAVVRSKLSLSIFSSAEVEDCVANTFSEFYLNLDKYNSQLGSLKSWLCVMAKNNAVDVLRKEKIQSVSIDLADFLDIEDDFSLELEVENEAVRREVLNEIKNLGEPDSIILIKKFYLNQSSQQIADALKMTVTNVNTRTHRAIQKLKKVFGGDR